MNFQDFEAKFKQANEEERRLIQNILEKKTEIRKPETSAKTTINTKGKKQAPDEISSNHYYFAKEVLTSNEVADYMGISKSCLYKLTMRRVIPHYKPMGKMCYFNRKEIEAWLQSNRVATTTEINNTALNYGSVKRKGNC